MGGICLVCHFPEEQRFVNRWLNIHQEKAQAHNKACLFTIFDYTYLAMALYWQRLLSDMRIIGNENMGSSPFLAAIGPIAQMDKASVS